MAISLGKVWLYCKGLVIIVNGKLPGMLVQMDVTPVKKKVS